MKIFGRIHVFWDDSKTNKIKMVIGSIADHMIKRVILIKSVK
jgi:hypothetical protein